MKLKTFAVYLVNWFPDIFDPIRYIKAKDLDHAWKLAKKKFITPGICNPIISKIEEV